LFSIGVTLSERYWVTPDERRGNPLAAWELRVGPVRIFYEVDAEEADVVNVLAIGIKSGNRLFIAGQEMRI
jgi:hypothetical protein